MPKLLRWVAVIVVVGETGSGKTTQLAQFLYEDGYCQHSIIRCTQPHCIAAMSFAKRVSKEMEARRWDTPPVLRTAIQRTPKSNVRVVYLHNSEYSYLHPDMTDGVLLRESLNEGDLDRYSVVILDGAHDRSLSTDVLMSLLRKILSRRRDLKLIVTSAAMNAEKFSDFYGQAPCFTIPGRTLPVEIFYSKSPCEDYVDNAVEKDLQTHLQFPPDDILVFVTGQEDIEVTCQVATERLSQLDDLAPSAVLPIHSQVLAGLQAKIFEATSGGKCNVIVAAKIAETSLAVSFTSWTLGAHNSRSIIPRSAWMRYKLHLSVKPTQINVQDVLVELGSKFPMEPSMAKMLIASVEYKCSAEMLTIASIHSVPSVFYRPKERQEADAARKKFSVDESDHLTLLNVFQQWKSHGFRDGWCMRHLLHPKLLRKACEVRQQLEDIMKMQRMELLSACTDFDLVRKAICSGYFHQAVRVKGIGQFVNIRSGYADNRDPSDTREVLGDSEDDTGLARLFGRDTLRRTLGHGPGVSGILS
ncbi:P-loop containing nucleoside triphosphate hydrolase protein [Ceratobasidium theobromae]|uniref:P-loop containing nucleoside triphosphate hydrolase protein n=1 Tax=Ceratobasidium theobromae TaxID=1582974 RepID=A0A5N5QDZ5_9AGAM|nr:P-loop containing nucleoside triphosphate hydrolase protein [Ceratobasidium theobromae]